METLCDGCLRAGYDRLTHPQPIWRRLRPRFRRANFAAFGVLFFMVFGIWRFDYFLFHSRHMASTDTSLIVATLFACVAFFIDTTGKSSDTPRIEVPFDWPRFLRLAAIEVLIGAVLYAVFIFTPTAVSLICGLASWIVIQIDIFDPKRTRSLGSLLCALTAIPSTFCLIAWRITDQDIWMTRMLVCGTLMAGLIVLDRWEDVQ